MTTKKLQLTAPVEVTAAADTSKPKRFRATVYTGGILKLREFFYPVVIDLRGMRIPRQDNPVFRDHDPDRLVGHTDAITVGRQDITASGIISGIGEPAQELLALAANGFPWQVSVGADTERMEKLEAGGKAVVNDKEFAGPLFIARASTFRELSFVPLGADVGSSAIVSSGNRKKGNTMDQDTEVQTDVSTAARQAAATENERREKISAAVAKFVTDRPEFLEEAEDLGIKAVAENWDPMKAELELLRASRPKLGPMVHKPSPAFTADHIAAALMVKAGFAKTAEEAYGERVMEQSKRLHRQSLMDLTAVALRLDRRDIPDGKEAMIKAAVSPSTASLPVALGNTANKVAEAAYRQAPSAWRSFAAVKSTTDFKTNTSLRPTWGSNLSKLPPGGEVKHGSIGEEIFSWAVDTYGKQIGIDRRDWINDDASVLADVIPGLARAAARALNNLVAETILANAGTFWSLANLNYQEGASTALSAASLGDAIELLRKMKDGDGTILDLEPRVLLVPPDLEVTARALLQSAEMLRSGADQLPTGNVFVGLASLAIEPRLSDSAFTGNSAVAWYLFSAPSNAAVIVGFLDGVQTPTVDTFDFSADINKLTLGFRIYHDFGCALGDRRASIKSKGAA
ncbi:MAG: Mu-like prophage major head subunit gpT family protein [Gemmataceae bacterium]|nr:Mu-like prophage major head subunit gpT family protein [Gemmataceae bacterium]MCI0740190.1 Mu-like prophage major head subunit gpT family protein [Gemmataceae bacterium]